MVRSGLGRLPLAELDLLLIENVGNLVCPAEFDVGQHARAMVYALTEGEEKPLKYPVMFRACRRGGGQQDRPPARTSTSTSTASSPTCGPSTRRARLIRPSARTGEGVEEWCDWLLEVRRGT